jgi:hypothetical protein
MQGHITLILLCEAETAMCWITGADEAIQQENDQYPLRGKTCDILSC